MTALTFRQRNILRCIVSEYSNVARPVSSKSVCENYAIGYSPATVRYEMLEMEKEGFLIQPHTSAGRIPSDKGLRYFVDELIEKDALLESERALFDARLFQLQGEAFLAMLAHISSVIVRDLILLTDSPKGELHFAGLTKLIKKPEFQERERLLPVVSVIEETEAKPALLFELLDDKNTHVFIGSESPFTQKTDTSLVVGGFRANSDIGLIAVLGPKRMNYARNLSVVEYLSDLLEQHFSK